MINTHIFANILVHQGMYWNYCICYYCTGDQNEYMASRYEYCSTEDNRWMAEHDPGVVAM